jgi:LysR family transcriptional regulator, nod-box dependent transcriptional activator
MRLNRFDLNLLIALDALLREKHITRAADRVCVSQPTMSSALAKLRHHFNDPLLARVGRAMELTPRGSALVEPVREALLRIQATLGTQVPFSPPTVRRTFIVMADDFLIPRLAPPLIRRLIVEAPGVRLQFERCVMGGFTRLASSEIDFLVSLDDAPAIGRASVAEWACHSELGRTSWVCALAKDHPDVGGELSREQYLTLPHVHVRMPGDSRSAQECARQQLGVDMEIPVTVDSVLQLPFVLPGTRLIAVVPEALAEPLQRSLDIRILPLPHGVSKRGRTCLFWHKRQEADAAHTWLRELWREMTERH